MSRADGSVPLEMFAALVVSVVAEVARPLTRATGTVPEAIVPSVVMFAEPAHVDSAVFSTLPSPTFDFASEVIQDGSASDPLVMCDASTVMLMMLPLASSEKSRLSVRLIANSPGDRSAASGTFAATEDRLRMMRLGMSIYSVDTAAVFTAERGQWC